MPFDEYIKTYTDSLRDVIKETQEKYPEESTMLFEFIDNWIDLFPKDEEKSTEARNSLSGIILINSWKLMNWISYEILVGAYLEAIRNLRFVFEGCVFAIIVEDAIEGAVFDKWGTLGDLFLKGEIFRLWEECKKEQVYKIGKVDQNKVSKIVTDFVNHNMDPLRKDDTTEYIEVYTKILLDARLYLSTTKMIEYCKTFLRIDKNDTEQLKLVWHEMSSYIHFSHKYLHVIIEDPEFIFVEKVNDELLKSSVAFYLQTLDFLYAVLFWRLPIMREQIISMNEWWKSNFKKRFELTEKVIKKIKEE